MLGVDLLKSVANISVPECRSLPRSTYQAILSEYSRLVRAVENNDISQAIGCLKDLLESIGRSTLELAGTPASNSTAYNSVINDSKKYLIDQTLEGEETPKRGRNIATQTVKSAIEIGELRNEFGTGHGRSYLSELKEDTAVLAIIAGLNWVHWALPRLDSFARSRPSSLISDLVGTNEIFTRGELSKRLNDANLQSLEPQDQRSIGVAVCRRASQGTFVVRDDGVKACIFADDVQSWPEPYRVGLCFGLCIDIRGNPTVSRESIELVIQLAGTLEHSLDPLSDLVHSLSELHRNHWITLSQEDKVYLAPLFNHFEENSDTDSVRQVMKLRDLLDVPPF